MRVGNPREITALELAEPIRSFARSASPVPVDGPRRGRLDISTAQAALGWRRHVLLEAASTRTLDWRSEDPGRRASEGLADGAGVGETETLLPGLTSLHGFSTER